MKKESHRKTAKDLAVTKNVEGHPTEWSRKMNIIERGRFVVSNIASNVGKSEISRHLLAPRVQNAQLISVESLNTNGSGEEMDASRFDEIMELVLLSDAAVVDVGSADFREFMIRMVQLHGSHETIDFFVLPVIAAHKQQIETVKTIKLLRAMGVERERIRIVFNMTEPGEEVARTFAVVFSEEGNATLNPRCKIEQSPFFDLFKTAGMTVEQLANDGEDYWEKMKSPGLESELKKLYFSLWRLKGYFNGASANLNNTFEALIA